MVKASGRKKGNMKSLLTLSGLSGILYFVGNIFYFCYIARDRNSKPQWAPWLVFTVVESIILGWMWKLHTDQWMIWLCTVGSWGTLYGTFRYRNSGFKKWDVVCIALAFASIIIGIGYVNYMTGLVIILLVEALAMAPICFEAWKDQFAEPKWGWAFFWVSCILQTMDAVLTTGGKWDTATYAQPISFLFTETIIFVIVWFPRQQAKRWLADFKQTANIGATVFETEW